MKFCPKCGSEVPDQMSFCATCGTRIENAPLLRKCPHCGVQNQLSNVTCTNCGKSIAGGNQPQKKNTQITDFLAIGFGILSIILYNYYIGIGFGVAALLYGYRQAKDNSKVLGIVGMIAGALGIMATIGLIIG